MTPAFQDLDRDCPPPGKPLAIVIPVWKTEFLARTLEAFAAQTSKEFRLYIGDDCSPAPVEQVVAPFRDRIDLAYHRFESNLGGKDLVGQWNRCISLTSQEPWIWLFSDDDLVDPTCVEDLLRAISVHPSASILRFDLKVVDESDRTLHESKEFPAFYPTLQFYRDRRDGKFESYATEFVFSRDAYSRTGFVQFDLAWGSDICTWTAFAGRDGIRTIGPGKVSWRKSSLNITPNNFDLSLLERKIGAEAKQVSWASGWFREMSLDWTPLDEIKQIAMASRGGLKDWTLRKPWRMVGFTLALARESPLRLSLPIAFAIVGWTRLRCLWWHFSRKLTGSAG